MSLRGRPRGGGRGGSSSAARGNNAADLVDALTARLADVSNHAVIDLGTGATAVDFSDLELKPDHERRPFWVTPTGSIFLEATSPLYEQARDFLVAICEPVSRPDFVHEYRLDKNALFAAASMGLTSDLIISAMTKLSKVPLADSVVDFVEACTSGYGKVKLVLKRGRYFIESAYPSLLRLLASHPSIRSARVWYGPDGRRVVGQEGERLGTAATAANGTHASGIAGASGAGAGAGSKGAAGFEVSSALAEAEGSLGLSGIVSGSGAGAGVGGSSVGDTAGGTMTSRVRGEVDSDEELDEEVESGAVSGLAARASPSAMAHVPKSGATTSANSISGGVFPFPSPSAGSVLGVGSSSSGSSSSASASDGFNYLSNDDLDQLFSAIDEVEQALEEASAAKERGEAPKGKYGNVVLASGSSSSSSSAAVGAAPDVTTRRGTSFAGDMSRLGLTSLAPITSAKAAGPPLVAPPPPPPAHDRTTRASATGIASSGSSDGIVPPVLTVSAPSTIGGGGGAGGGGGGSKLKLRVGNTAITGLTSSSSSSAAADGPQALSWLPNPTPASSSTAASSSSSSSSRPPPVKRTRIEGAITDENGNVLYDSDDDDDDWNLDRLLSDEEDDLEEMGVKTKAPKPASSKAKGGGKAKKGGPKKDDDDGDYADDDDVGDDDDDAGFTRKRKGAKARAAAAGAKAAAAAAAAANAEDAEDDDMADFSARLSRLRSQLSKLHTPGRVESFEIDGAAVDNVKKSCLYLDPPLPLMQEYDFRNDAALPSLHFALRDASMLRPYQQRSLAKMFGNGRARSGIIVLPCGAGKTLVGISAAVTMGKSCIVLCPNQTSVLQWVESFVRFTDISRSNMVTLTAKKKEPLPPLHEAVILLTTYSMIGSGGRAKESAAVLRDIAAREWGLLLLDEVHQAVANTFSRVLRLRAHCRLGLTATLVREDGRDRNLSHLIGPKLYEANWRDLTRAGYLANVQVVEVWCPMPPAFYREYLRCDGMNTKKALAVMNPVKCWAMDRLLKMHEERGDKIIIFSESVFALKLYAKQYNTLAICGDTPPMDRETFIKSFKTPNSGINKLFLSKVGDVALDVPDANVIIQISSHFGSRLQEAQRMGRILRRGRNQNASSGSNSFFYTLISTDTLETYFANKRRRYLVDQGYAYIVRPADCLADKQAVEQLARAQLASMGQLDAGGEGGGGGVEVEGADVATGAITGRGGRTGGGFVLDSPTGLEALRLSASFAADPQEQLRILELTLRANIDADEAAEDKLFAQEASQDSLLRSARDSAKAAALAKLASGGAGAGGAGGGASSDITTRTLAGRPTMAAPVAPPPPANAPIRRELSGLAALSGGTGLAYLEYESAPGTGGASALARLEAGERAEHIAAIRAARAAGASAPAPKPAPPPSVLDAY